MFGSICAIFVIFDVISILCPWHFRLGNNFSFWLSFFIVSPGSIYDGFITFIYELIQHVRSSYHILPFFRVDLSGEISS